MILARSGIVLTAVFNFPCPSNEAQGLETVLMYCLAYFQGCSCSTYSAISAKVIHSVWFFSLGWISEFNNGACHWRSGSAAPSSQRRGCSSVSPTASPQTWHLYAGCSSGHHRCQFWTWKRSRGHSFATTSHPSVCVCVLGFECNTKGVFCVAECARAFHAAGARLMLCGRDATRLQQVVEELTTTSACGIQKVCTILKDYEHCNYRQKKKKKSWF